MNALSTTELQTISKVKRLWDLRRSLHKCTVQLTCSICPECQLLLLLLLLAMSRKPFGGLPLNPGKGPSLSFLTDTRSFPTLYQPAERIPFWSCAEGWKVRKSPGFESGRLMGWPLEKGRRGTGAEWRRREVRAAKARTLSGSILQS